MTPEEHNQLKSAAAAWCSRDGSVASGKQCGDELLFWLDAHPPVRSVPVSDLRAWQRNGWVTDELEALIRMAEPKPPLPPNPHQQGTYLWAMEEHARKSDVSRRGEPGFVVVAPECCKSFRCNARIDWDFYRFSNADFTATDWEVVK